MVKEIIRNDLNVIVFSFVGAVTLKEVIEKIQFLKARDRIRPGTNIAIDTREQINIFTRDEVLKILFEIIGTDKNPLVSKTAIITVSNEEYGTGKLYSAYKNKKKIEAVVFSDIDKVLQWMGIPKDKIHL
jgi:hypothetical protein